MRLLLKKFKQIEEKRHLEKKGKNQKFLEEIEKLKFKDDEKYKKVLEATFRRNIKAKKMFYKCKKHFQKNKKGF